MGAPLQHTLFATSTITTILSSPKLGAPLRHTSFATSTITTILSSPKLGAPLQHTSFATSTLPRSSHHPNWVRHFNTLHLPLQLNRNLDNTKIEMWHLPATPPRVLPFCHTTAGPCFVHSFESMPIHTKLHKNSWVGHIFTCSFPGCTPSANSWAMDLPVPPPPPLTPVPVIGVGGCSSSSSFTCKCSSDAAIAAGGQKCLTLVCAVAPLQVGSHANAARTLQFQQEDRSAWHWCGRLRLLKFVHMQMQLRRCNCGGSAQRLSKQI